MQIQFYIQRIKYRPLEARKDVDERDLEKIDQCVILFGDVKLMIADDTEGLPLLKEIMFLCDIRKCRRQ